MEYDWYADLFFLEEVYRDVLILWLAAVLMRRRAEVLRLLGAGIAGTLQYWKRLSGTYGKMSCRRTAGIRWDMGSLETSGDRIFDDLDRFSGKTDHAPGEKECFCR